MNPPIIYFFQRVFKLKINKAYCDTLRDLVPFAQFKKRENTHGEVLLLSLQLY